MNLSPHELQSGNVDDIISMVRTNGVFPTTMFEIEITEEALLLTGLGLVRKPFALQMQELQSHLMISAPDSQRLR
jgi:hypothetical protein